MQHNMAKHKHHTLGSASNRCWPCNSQALHACQADTLPANDMLSSVGSLVLVLDLMANSGGKPSVLEIAEVTSLRAGVFSGVRFVVSTGSSLVLGFARAWQSARH